MDKQQIITFIQQQISEGKITKGDLDSISTALPSSDNDHPAKNLINVFYAIGAIIVLIGVIILLAQNWSDIGFLGRIVTTLGISFGAYVAGLLLRKPDQDRLSQVMFAISFVLAPFGSYVFLREASIDFTSGVQIITALIWAIIFGTALYITRKNILVLFTIALVTWAYYALAVKVFAVGYYYDIGFIKWATMIVGVSYLLIAYKHASDVVRNTLYAFGTLAILGAGISIGGAFDIVFIALIFAGFYGSVYLKNRAMLILSAIFLTAHIIKLTSKYFVNSISWPVALIAVGFVVIGIGYMTLYLNKKYISKN